MPHGKKEKMNSKNKIEIVIIGSGAVGSVYGGMLSLLPETNVSILCRSDYDTVKQNGIKIESIWKNFIFNPCQVIKNLQEYEGIPDYIIVTLKVLPEINLTKILNSIHKSSVIVLLQNGIGIEKKAKEEFPENDLLSCLAFTCINRISSGYVKHYDYGTLNLGAYGELKNNKSLFLLNDLFSKAGVPCSVSDDILSARWKKLVWNAPFNPISVLGGGIDTEQILKHPETLLLTEQVMKEVISISKADGHSVPDETVQRMIDMTLNMNPYKTSMLLDYEAGRPMEVEAILGNSVRIAKEYNLKVPHMETMYALLKIMNDNNSKRKMKA